MQLLAGTDAGTGVMGHVLVWGEFCCSAPQYGRGHGGGDEGHTQEHTHTHTHTQEHTHTHTHRNVHANVARTL